MTAPEVRTLPVESSCLRLVDAAGARPVIAGYAALFNSPSVNMGGFRERIRPGAFSRALEAGADIRALVNHNPDLMLGRNTSGTLRLAEDDRGLRVEIDPPDTVIAQHYLEGIRRGDFSGMSFRFYIVSEDWDLKSDPVQRTLLDVDIDDVSIVTYPAYPDTTVALRSLDSFRRAHPPGTPRRNRAARLLRLADA